MKSPIVLSRAIGFSWTQSLTTATNNNNNNHTDHPDFGRRGHLPVWLKYPAVVREELLEDQAHGEDEKEPQHGAKKHGRHQHLTLRTHGLAVGGDGEKGCGTRVETTLADL